jgi:hypothetical protein
MSKVKTAQTKIPEVVTVDKPTMVGGVMLPKGQYWITKLEEIDPDALVKAAGAFS